MFAVRCHCNAGYMCGLFEDRLALARRQVPNAQRLVVGVGAGDHVATIGGDCHGIDRARMTFERADRLAALQVPYPERFVIGSRDGTAAVGRHRHHGMCQQVGMAFERTN